MEFISCKNCGGFQNSVFKFCTSSEIDSIDEHKNIYAYERKRVLFQEGDLPFNLYCVCWGKIKVVKQGPDHKKIIVRIAKKSDLIGYSSLLTGAPYTVSALALEDSRVCAIPKSDIFDLLNHNATFSKTYYDILGTGLAAAFKKMSDIAYKPVLGRVAEALLILSQIYTNENNPAGIIDINRSELASFTGTVRESATRCLHELKTDNAIKIIGRYISIRDRQKLAAVSKLYD